MQIVIPMSGTGQRFLKAGYSDPKPLIKVGGKPIIEYIVKNFSTDDEFLFICNEDHLKNTPMKKILESLAPKNKIVTIAPHTKGPVYAVAQAFEHIKDSEQTIVNYCDFNWRWNYADFKNQMQKSGIDGSVICYKGFHPHLLGPNFYAGCKTDAQNHLIEIKEKFSFTANKMDSYQSSGTYYFKSGQIVKKYFKQLIDENIALNGEFYVSLVYNLPLRDKLKINVYEIPYFCQWGTPEDLKEFEYWQEIFQ